MREKRPNYRNSINTYQLTAGCLQVASVEFSFKVFVYEIWDDRSGRFPLSKRAFLERGEELRKGRGGKCTSRPAFVYLMCMQSILELILLQGAF